MPGLVPRHGLSLLADAVDRFRTIDNAEEMFEPLVLDLSKWFSQAIGRLLVGWDLDYHNGTTVHFLTAESTPTVHYVHYVHYVMSCSSFRHDMNMDFQE